MEKDEIQCGNRVAKERSNMRQLASIKRIGKIHPIEGKDRIVLAEVDPLFLIKYGE